jgi:predicted nucleic acid-binding protein
MIVVDTSVWIEFFRNNSLYFAEIRKHIEEQKVLAFEPVFGELLQGVKNLREKEIIEQYWKYLPRLKTEECWIKAGSFSSDRKLISHGVGLIDSCIAIASIETNSTVWSLDKKLLSILPEEFVYVPSVI